MENTDLRSLPAGSRVLVVLADLVGDTLFRTPVVHLLSRHYPELRFDALVFSGAAAAVLGHSDAVGQVHMLRRRRAVRELAEGHDLLINLRRTNMRKYLGGLSVPCLSYRKGSRAVHKAEDLLRYGGTLLPDSAAIGEDDRRYRFDIRDAERDRVGRILSEHGVDPERETLIGIHPGCGGVADYQVFFALQGLIQHRKTWPVARHAELADRLTAARPGVRCIAVGSGKEALLARRVVRSVPGGINLAGQLSLPELAALMDRLSLFVCHDTGPLHMACARTTPLVALLGPTRPERTGPWPDLPRFTVLRGERMRGIAVEEAERAALQKLDAPDESSGRANGDQASPNPTARLSGPAPPG